VGLGRVYDARSRPLPACARLVALVYNWWNLFVRLAEPTRHLEAITSRLLLLTSIAERLRHARQTTLRIASTHRSALGGPCFGTHRRFFAWSNDKCGAVDPHRALVPHPHTCGSTFFERTRASAAAAAVDAGHLTYTSELKSDRADGR
jgi:hypothetical protein